MDATAARKLANDRPVDEITKLAARYIRKAREQGVDPSTVQHWVRAFYPTVTLVEAYRAVSR